MNELFAAEPSSCENAAELRRLLDLFGPYAGRYLAAYPADDWRQQVHELFRSRGDVEEERARPVLRRARERTAVLGNDSLPWDPAKPWISNAVQLMDSQIPRFRGVVAARLTQFLASPGLYTLDTLELSPTADEKIKATAEEYARVSRTLLVVSGELLFVDPYLNPCSKDVFPVMEEMLKVVAKKSSRCERIVCWVRKVAILDKDGRSIKDVVESLRELIRRAGLNRDFRFEYLLVDDKECPDHMHGRYLLSVKGGIRFDQGFRQLQRGRKVDISPVGSKVHADLLRTYLEGQHKMKIEFRLELRDGRIVIA